MLNGPKLEGFTGRRKGQCYQVCTDKVKVARTDEKHCHTLIEDPQKIMTVMILSPSLPLVDAFDKNKRDICQQDKKFFTKNKGARSREPSSLNETAIGSASLQPRF